MNLSPVSYSPNVMLRANINNQQQKVETPKAEKTPKLGKTNLPYTPATVGILNGALWTGIGLAFDKVFSLISKTPRSLKSSLILNGIIGLGMGAFAYSRAKKDFAAAEVQKQS